MAVKPRFVVSSCLIGKKCRYDGKDMARDFLLDLYAKGEVIDVCPEQLGGLSTPRPPAEIREGRVININSEDVTLAYENGAKKALEIIAEYHLEKAYLKSKSPMCGCGKIYDGTYTGKLAIGDGIFTKMFKERYNLAVEEVE